MDESWVPSESSQELEKTEDEKRVKKEDIREWCNCSTCGGRLYHKRPGATQPPWHRHPVLLTLQCVKCNTFYNKGNWLKDDDGYYEHCRWCGDGSSL